LGPRWGAGVGRTRSFPGGETYHFRAYSSAGALYPLELYVACAPLPDVEGGLYHFHPRELALEAPAPERCAGLARRSRRRARPGRGRRRARGHRDHVSQRLEVRRSRLPPPVLGGGHDARQPGRARCVRASRPRLLTAFAGGDVSRLLGIDGEREAALALLAIGRAGRLDPREPDVEPISRDERRYREAVELHAASCLYGAHEVRASPAAALLARGSGGEAEAAARAGVALSRDRLEAVIRRRGSTREFALGPVPVAEASAILTRAGGPLPADVPPLNDLYVTAHALDGLEPDAYAFSPPDRFQPTRRADLRRAAACLEQALGATSAATVFLMVDLERALKALGSRGYRAASLDAGVRAGRIYLGAYAQALAPPASPSTTTR